MSSNTTAPITENTPIKTDLRTMLAVIGFAVFAAVAWATLKLESADHGRRLSSIEATISNDHDILLELRGASRAKRTSEAANDGR